MLKENLDRFVPVVYSRTHRTAETYQTVARRCRRNLIRLAEEYNQVVNNAQELREIRIEMDDALRRYHEYCIQERDGMLAHYHEIGADEDCDFEHLIPAKILRDLLLGNVITIDQALNAPTVRLSRAKHVALKDAGWASKTPSMWLPFKRYTNVFEATYQTHDGTEIDPLTWTLEKHYNYFKHLVIS
jgi:hypothetical protein